MEVTFGVNRFRRCVGVFVVFLEQHGATHEDLAIVRNLDLDTGRRLTDRVELHPAVGL